MYVIVTENPKVIDLARKEGCPIIPIATNSDNPVVMSLDDQITDFLKDLGIPIDIDGFVYLKEILLKSISEPGFERSPTVRTVYPYVARIYNKNDSNAVERCIRHAIYIAVQENTEFFQLLFTPANNIPNKRFIISIVDYFRRKVYTKV